MSVCFQYFSTLDAFSLEVGLFGTDVTTDWMNGLNLINDGHTFWGIIMALLPFTPVAIVALYPFFGFLVFVAEKSGRVLGWCCDLGCCGCFVCPLAFVLLSVTAISIGLVLYIPGVVLFTAGYILFVLASGCIKAARPDIESLDRKDKVLGCIKPKHVNKYTPVLRTAEVASESYPQSILGE